MSPVAQLFQIVRDPSQPAIVRAKALQIILAFAEMEKN